jgi:serine O-acetyltransferase
MNKVLLDTIKELSKTEGFKDVCHEQGQNDPMPSVDVLKEVVQLARSILFPGFFGDSAVTAQTRLYHIGVNIDRLQVLLAQQIRAGMCFDSVTKAGVCNEMDRIANDKATEFVAQLPVIREKLHTDVIAAYNCYPSIRAISNYRIAHALLQLGVPLIPRIITEMAHSETGIDIHPGATIGEYFTIDHGTGVVIGETTVIGKNVKMYQGVTLGAKSFPLDENGNPIKGIDRHPKIGNDVIIYSNSTILGAIKVGDGAVIGGNLWVDTDVPAGAKLAQKR